MDVKQWTCSLAPEQLPFFFKYSRQSSAAPSSCMAVFFSSKRLTRNPSIASWVFYPVNANSYHRFLLKHNLKHNVKIKMHLARSFDCHQSLSFQAIVSTFTQNVGKWLQNVECKNNNKHITNMKLYMFLLQRKFINLWQHKNNEIYIKNC